MKIHFISKNQKNLSFVNKKQFAINNDIIFPLQKKDLNINEIIHELYIKNNELSHKYEDLSQKYNNFINELNELKEKINFVETLIPNEDINVIIDNFFIYNQPKKWSIIYMASKHGDKAKDLFKYCGEKNNLIILFEDKNNNKFRGFISKKLPKDNSYYNKR